MINNTLEQLKSEGARLGFLGLSLETLLERSKKSVELEYHKVKSLLLNRMNRIRTKLDNTDIELDTLSSLIKKMDFTINGIVGSLFLILKELLYLKSIIFFAHLMLRYWKQEKRGLGH